MPVQVAGLTRRRRRRGGQSQPGAASPTARSGPGAATATASWAMGRPPSGHAGASGGLTGVAAVAQVRPQPGAEDRRHGLGLGRQRRGQLGDSTTTRRHTPVQVAGLTGVDGSSAAAMHSLALSSDGTVRAWGSNGSGQLGDGTTITPFTPVTSQGLSSVLQLAGRGGASIAGTRHRQPDERGARAEARTVAAGGTGHLRCRGATGRPPTIRSR